MVKNLIAGAELSMSMSLLRTLTVLDGEQTATVRSPCLSNTITVAYAEFSATNQFILRLLPHSDMVEMSMTHYNLYQITSNRKPVIINIKHQISIIIKM